MSEDQRLFAAFMLAPSIGTAEALLLGDTVSALALDKVWCDRLRGLGLLHGQALVLTDEIARAVSLQPVQYGGSLLEKGESHGFVYVLRDDPGGWEVDRGGPFPTWADAKRGGLKVKTKDMTLTILEDR